MVVFALCTSELNMPVDKTLDPVVTCGDDRVFMLNTPFYHDLFQFRAYRSRNSIDRSAASMKLWAVFIPQAVNVLINDSSLLLRYGKE